MSFDLFKKVAAQLEADEIRVENNTTVFLPKSIRTFLGELGLLYHIPLYYMLPDERYLPATVINKQGEEAFNDGGVLKVFRLDKEWIECLLDGALSIGEQEDRRFLLNQSLAGNYVAEVYYDNVKAQIIKQIQGAYSPEDFELELNKRLENRHVKLKDNRAIPTNAQSNWNYTGFLIRSTLISAWVGVEVIAKGENLGTDAKNTNKNQSTQQALQILRLERWADDTLFCLCEGIIRQVEVRQPPESFHFDITNRPISYKINTTNTPGVVKIADLAAKLNSKDSANFAKTMSFKPLKMLIDINWKKINT